MDESTKFMVTHLRRRCKITARISCIIKKELSDAASNKIFLLSCAVLLISFVCTGISAGNSYYYYHLTLSEHTTTDIELILMRELVPPIRIVGALVAVAYGFNAINKERAEGSLKILLSYPVFRDQVILGKLLASVMLIVFTSFVSLTLTLIIYLVSTNLFFSFNQFIRYFVFMCLSSLLLSGYLGLSMFLSIAFKDPKTSLIAIFLLISVFNSWIFFSYGRLITDAVYGPEINPEWLFTSADPQRRALREFIQNLSPSYSFLRITNQLVSRRFAMYVGSELVLVESNTWRVLSNRLDDVVRLVIIPILSFSASYVYFTRSEIT